MKAIITLSSRSPRIVSVETEICSASYLISDGKAEPTLRGWGLRQFARAALRADDSLRKLGDSVNVEIIED